MIPIDKAKMMKKGKQVRNKIYSTNYQNQRAQADLQVCQKKANKTNLKIIYLQAKADINSPYNKRKELNHLKLGITVQTAYQRRQKK